jgi:hypothetical protein
MPTADNSNTERIRHLKHRVMFKYRMDFFQKHGYYPQEQGPGITDDSTRQDRRVGSGGYTFPSNTHHPTIQQSCGCV